MAACSLLPQHFAATERTQLPRAVPTYSAHGLADRHRTHAKGARNGGLRLTFPKDALNDIAVARLEGVDKIIEGVTQANAVQDFICAWSWVRDIAIPRCVLGIRGLARPWLEGTYRRECRRVDVGLCVAAHDNLRYVEKSEVHGQLEPRSASFQAAISPPTTRISYK